jgi:hypothetical protein
MAKLGAVAADARRRAAQIVVDGRPSSFPLGRRDRPRRRAARLAKAIAGRREGARQPRRAALQPELHRARQARSGGEGPRRPCRKGADAEAERLARALEPAGLALRLVGAARERGDLDRAAHTSTVTGVFAQQLAVDRDLLPRPGLDPQRLPRNSRPCSPRDRSLNRVANQLQARPTGCGRSPPGRRSRRCRGRRFRPARRRRGCGRWRSAPRSPRPCLLARAVVDAAERAEANATQIAQIR